MGEFEYGETCTLVATPNADYVFIKWLKDGVQQVSSGATYSFMVTEDAHFSAVFASNSCLVTASVDPEEGGTVTGTGTYAYGSTVTLTVNLSSDYELINWTENGQEFSTEETITFVVEGNRNFVAHVRHIDGIDEQGISINVFPNPAKFKMTVETSEPVDLFEIYTIDGMLVYTEKNCSDRIEVDVTHFVAGTYMIRMTTNSTVAIRRFVKE